MDDHGWSYARQGLGRRASDVETALHDVVGVYSRHPNGPLSIYARAREPDPAAFRRLDGERLALRLPAMRGAAHLLPRETAHLAFHAVVDSPRAAQRESPLAGEVLSAARRPRTAGELRTRTDAKPEALKSALAELTRSARLLRVGADNLRSNALRYVETEAWLGGPLPGADRDEALAWLAGEYLRAFGPARADDFQWWAGVGAARAVAALDTLELVEVGDGLLLPRSDARSFEAAEPPPADAIDLLPRWDPHTLATAGSDGRGVVLVGGEPAGHWGGRFAGRRMEVQLELFEPPSAGLQGAIEAEFAAMAAFLEAKALAIR
jgi:hypothetical protein